MRSKLSAEKSGRRLNPRFKCEKCEGRLDIPDEPTKDMTISCKACGTPIGTWTQVKAAMKKSALRAAL
jgi:hypothetical protein